MSGGAFDYFYYKVEDKLSELSKTLYEMIGAMQEDPERFDPRAVELLKDFGGSLTVLHAEAMRLNNLIHDIEWVASNDYGPACIRAEVDKLLADDKCLACEHKYKWPAGAGGDAPRCLEIVACTAEPGSTICACIDKWHTR